ncbi:MAG: hypothetical protein ACRDLV_15695 [Solirubrobacteraceae bacterium]
MSSLHSPSTTRRSAPSRRGRAGVATAAVLLAVTPFAAACGAGFNAATDSIKPNAGAGTVGALKINNVWVVVDPASGAAEVIGAVANTGDTQVSLPQVSVDDTSATIGAPGPSPVDASVPPLSGIDAGQSISFGEQGQPEIALNSSSLTPGNLAKVTFDFGSTGSATINAQIESNTGLFAAYNPDGGSSTAGASTSATPSTSASGDLGASPSTSASSGAGLPSSSASASGSTSTSASASATPSPSAS